ncbi:uncharacterized protein LOC111037551 [Myzus persicae]|uniref:uncharacterized protein LOC111037551 n=1 Tax=Myzus persicae TaxID=13164 RepID=UPI000B93663C|nr:uncharacterized protein LOC111037551 [Myzus persicae]
MAALKFIFTFIIGDFIEKVMLFNPMLTYSVRYKKVYAHPSHLGNFTIHQLKETQFINGNLTIPPNFFADKVMLSVCPFWLFCRCDADGINCEYFQTWKLTDICTKLKDKNQIWSRWYGSFDPPVVCPFDKVHYQMRNGTIDLGIATLLYPLATDYQWRVLQKIYGNNRCIGVMVIEVSIFGYRKKIKLIPKL